MKRIIDISINDLRQLMRDKQTFIFLLAMPIVFTLVFGFAFGSFDKQDETQDNRYLVQILDESGDPLAPIFIELVTESTVITQTEGSLTDLETAKSLVLDGKADAVLRLPQGFSESIYTGSPLAVEIIAKEDNLAAYQIELETMRITNRLVSAIFTAQTVTETNVNLDFETVFESTLAAWDNPPLNLRFESREDLQSTSSNGMGASQTAPGMMLQFGMAGLLTAGQMMVNERKSRSFQRLLTTATGRGEILLGHFLSVFLIIFFQLVLLTIFGQLVMGLGYYSQPLATLVMVLASATCLAAMGTLIGMLAKTDNQAVIFALFPMFIFSGLGGAWMPLEFTGKAFQAVGHISPIAWGMDGFKAILNYGGGLETVWLPALALVGYGILFFALAAWRINTTQEQ